MQNSTHVDTGQPKAQPPKGGRSRRTSKIQVGLELGAAVAVHCRHHILRGEFSSCTSRAQLKRTVLVTQSRVHSRTPVQTNINADMSTCVNSCTQKCTNTHTHTSLHICSCPSTGRTFASAFADLQAVQLAPATHG